MSQKKLEDREEGSSPSKWGAAVQLDDTVPTQIARLTDLSGYYTFTNDTVESSTKELDEIANIIGPGPEEVETLEAVIASIESLPLFVETRVKESRQVVQVLEMYPTGETGYKTAMSLTRLLYFVKTLVEKIDNINGSEKTEKTENSESDDFALTSELECLKGETLDDRLKGGSDKDLTDKDSMVRESQRKEKESQTTPVSSEESRASKSSSSKRGKKDKDVTEIQYHDLRFLENQFQHILVPTVIVRKHAVLMSLNPLRAIVTADRLILIVPDGADSLLYMLHDFMHGIVDENEEFSDHTTTGQYTEIGSYKALFSTITAIHQQEFKSLSGKAERTLAKFESVQSITVELQEAIRLLKNSISSQIIKVAAYQRLLRQLIANKDELSLMNLSMLRDNHDHYRKPYSPELLDRAEDISELLETYLMDYNTLGTKLEFLRARMQNTDELVAFRLDSFRNDLLIADVTLAIIMLCLSVGTFVTNIFGMNLNTGIESTVNSTLFYVLNAALVVIMFLMFIFLSNRYRLTLSGAIPVVTIRMARLRGYFSS